MFCFSFVSPPIATTKKMKLKSKEPIRLRSKKLRNGNKSLYLDFYQEGQRRYEYLRLYLIPERNKLDKERNRTTLIQAEAMKAKRVIEYQQGKYGVVQNSAFNNILISEYLLRMADKLSGNKSKAYVYHLSIVARRIKSYNDVPIVKIDRAWLLGFISFLSGVAVAGRSISDTTKSVYMDKIHAGLQNAVRDGIIQSNPMDKLYPEERPRKNPREICFLTLDEVKRLMATPANNRSIMGAFLLACFTGLRWSDIKSLRWCHVKMLGGKLSIDKIQVKTKKSVVVPLSANALRVLPSRPGSASASDLVFPELPYLPYCNEFIGRWCEAAGIQKHVSFHVSRHTAATLWLTFGADLYTVSKLLGHTNISSTQIYAKVVDSLKSMAVDLVPSLE